MANSTTVAGLVGRFNERDGTADGDAQSLEITITLPGSWTGVNLELERMPDIGVTNDEYVESEIAVSCTETSTSSWDCDDGITLRWNSGTPKLTFPDFIDGDAYSYVITED